MLTSTTICLLITSGDPLKTSMLKEAPDGQFPKLLHSEELTLKVTYISLKMDTHQVDTSVMFKLTERSSMEVNNNSSLETHP